MVSINILHYNTFDKTKNCIESCLHQKKIDYKIILIDNSSTDDSFIRLKNIYGDRIQCVENCENYGFAKGTNIGIQYALNHDIKYSLLLNSDITLTDEETLYHLYLIMKKQETCAIVSPKIYNVTCSGLQFLDYDYGYLRLLRLTKILPQNKAFSNGLITVSEAHGSALFVDNKKIMSLGGFPESYFMYKEESTLSKKVLWSGYIIIKDLSDDCKILHHHDKTGKVDDWRIFLMGRNQAIEFYTYRNKAPIRWSIVYMIVYIKQLLKKNNTMCEGMKEGKRLYMLGASDDVIFNEGRRVKQRLDRI